MVVYVRTGVSCILLFFFLFIQSCIVESAPDEPEAVCKHKYAYKAEVLSVEDGNWDVFNGPDLRIDLKRTAANDWSFSTNTLEDWSGGGIAELFFNGEIYLTEESWEIQLVDQDDLTADDNICWDTFNPKYSTEGNTIDFSKNGTVVIKIYYDERAE